MKILKSTLWISLLALGLFACKNSQDQSKKEGKEYTSAYICPMHCEGSGSDVAGTCPVCGMDYVANKDAKKHTHGDHDHDAHSGHDHDHGAHGDHDGHNHDSHDGHDHGDGHNHGEGDGHDHDDHNHN